MQIALEPWRSASRSMSMLINVFMLTTTRSVHLHMCEKRFSFLAGVKSSATYTSSNFFFLHLNADNDPHVTQPDFFSFALNYRRSFLHLNLDLFDSTIAYHYFSIHKPRDSLFSWSSNFNDFSGLVNWGFLLLTMGGVRLLLENFIKYGFRVDPMQWFIVLTGRNEGDATHPSIILGFCKKNV